MKSQKLDIWYPSILGLIAGILYYPHIPGLIFLWASLVVGFLAFFFSYWMDSFYENKNKRIMQMLDDAHKTEIMTVFYLVSIRQSATFLVLLSGLGIDWLYRGNIWSCYFMFWFGFFVNTLMVCYRTARVWNIIRRSQD